MVLNAIGAALWVGVWTTVGDLAGHHITTLYPAITRFGRYELAALALVVLALLARMAVRRHRPTGSSPADSADSTDRQESADRKRDHAALHRDLRLPGRVHLDAGRIGLHPGAVRADHDPGRGAGGRGGARGTS